MSITGLLPLNKPVGVRSTECVEKIRCVLGKKNKVGHGGTLDSTASGVLVLLIGAATRLSEFVMTLPKCYETEVRLGFNTLTDDASGEITAQREWRGIREDSVDSALFSFIGTRMQKPPRISAVHVQGKRAHEMVRGGEEVQISAKPVYFASVKRISEISDDGILKFRIFCGKGTYVRSFARDMGELLGCGAHVHTLVRTMSGPFQVENLKDITELLALDREGLANEILPLETLCAAANCYTPSREKIRSLENGNAQQLKELTRKNFSNLRAATQSAVISAEGIFSVCKKEIRGDTILFSPTTNIFTDGGAGV